MADPINNDTAAALAAGAAIGTPRFVTGFRPFAIIPVGHEMRALDQEPNQPPRVKAKPAFHDAPSLIAYAIEHKQPGTTLFADIDSSQVVAILDYHEPVIGPEYCEHRAIYTARHSPEWLVWMEKTGEAMSQLEFAEFIEDNAVDVLTPSGAALLEIALSIEASKSGSFKSVRRLENGSLQFHYSEEVTGRSGPGQLEVPKEFTIQVRPYLGCVPHQLTARLRYRINDGRLSLWYDLLRPEVLKREAFDAILKRIADETQLGVLLGVPSP